MNNIITKDPLNKDIVPTNKPTSFIDTISNTLKNTVKTINDNVSNVANTVSNNVSNVANTVSNSVSGVSNRVSNVANTVSNRVSDVANTVSSSVSGVSNNNTIETDFQLINNDIDKVTSSIANTGNNNINSVISDNTSTSLTPFGFIKYFFIGCIVILLGTNYYYNVKTGKNIIQNIFGKIFEYLAKLFKIDIFQTSMKNNINILNNQLTNRAKQNTMNNKIYNDKLRTRTKLNSTKKAGNYCYIGEENGYRSCTRVDNENNCTSNKLYPTMDMCRKPKRG